MGFGFQNIPGMSRPTPVGRQDGDGAQQFARLQEQKRQHDNQMEFSRSEQERRKHEFATQFGLQERKFETEEERKLRVEQEDAWKLLKHSRDRRDPEGIQAAERKLQNLGFDVGQAYTEEGGREPRTEATEAPATVARETTPDLLNEDRAVQPRMPSFMSDMWPVPIAPPPGPPPQGQVAPPSAMQQGTELMRAQQMGQAPPTERPGVLNFNPLNALYQQQASEEQTEAAKAAARDTGLPIDKAPPPEQKVGVAGAAAATGEGDQTPLEAAQAAEAMGVERASARQRTVIRDRDGNVVDVWSPEEQTASQSKQYGEYTEQPRKFAGAAKRAWEQAKQLVLPKDMPAWEKEDRTEKAFWKFYAAETANDRARIAASRPRSGPRPVNEYHQGVSQGFAAAKPLRELGEKYKSINASLKGIDTKNPILTSAAIVGLARSLQSGQLSNQDINMLNLTPSTMSKLMNIVSLETAEEVDQATRERLGKALLVMRDNMKREAFSIYQGLRAQGSMAGMYGETGHAPGFTSAVMNAAGAFPGLAKPEHFGLGGGSASPAKNADPKKSKSILDKYK